MKELFIVEGTSAASTVRQAMHKPSQEVLALQGKLINVDKVTRSAMLKNAMCQKIIQTLGCGVGDEIDLNALSFSKIVILSDPDMDGTHARLLLMRFFELYLPALIKSGCVYLVVPPLFRLSNQRNEKFYAWNEEQRDALIKAHQNNLSISRMKGIAQFSLDECSTLLLSPDTRKQFQLCLSKNATDKN